jgi:hypothetical protein
LRVKSWVIAGVLAATSGCATAQAPPRVADPKGSGEAKVPPVAASPDAGAAKVATGAPRLEILLRPVAEPAPRVHVEVTADGPRAALQKWHLEAPAEGAVVDLTATDDAGAIPFRADGGTLTLGRDAVGVVHVRYDRAATTDAPARPLGQLVLVDRFRGSGEGLLFLPDAFDDLLLPIDVRIDGAEIHAPNAASSLGVGAARRINGRARALRRSTFIAGSMGAAIFDSVEGHDEAAWLGYTAFDPRPVVAEIAQVRTSMRELFSSSDPWTEMTYLVFGQTRPLGSFTTSARAGSLLLQVGPAEPWAAALRLSVAQQLIHRWIGGELWIGPTDAAHEAEAYWFTEGLARFMTTHVLAKLGLLTPGDVRDAIAGEASVLATSPHRAEGNVVVAARARTDDTARATLAARGALYAARVSALIRAKSKHARSLDDVVLALLKQAREARSALPVEAWVKAVTAELEPAEAASFQRIVVDGGDLTLPPRALGPCFREGTGEYVAFDLGFDDRATRESKVREVVGLEAGGPAARAGLRAGDVIEESDFRDGHAEVEARLTVRRAGDPKAMLIHYAPRGDHRRGQTWTRVPGITDDRCGEML